MLLELIYYAIWIFILFYKHFAVSKLEYMRICNTDALSVKCSNSVNLLSYIYTASLLFDKLLDLNKTICIDIRLHFHSPPI